MEFHNKVVFITGGLGGIGFSWTKYFLRAGAKGITIADCNSPIKNISLQALENEFGKRKVVFVQMDASKQEEVENAFERTVKEFHSLDIVVNNAGITSNAWEDEMDVNYQAAYRVFQLALKIYLPKYQTGSEGIIINMASVTGLDPHYAKLNYSSTKAAIISLGRNYSSKQYYNKYRVKILTLCPGYTTTTFTDELILGHPHFKTFIDKLLHQTPDDVVEMASKIISVFTTGDCYIFEDNHMYKWLSYQRPVIKKRRSLSVLNGRL